MTDLRSAGDARLICHHRVTREFAGIRIGQSLRSRARSGITVAGVRKDLADTEIKLFLGKTDRSM